ncbi:hypothetical protein ACFWPP_12950 [Streptomyces anulatus]|uniref:hypothetical protein n=1 Tax=Streptomyces anulatus TaxID=1892 RepID=UPI00365E07FD
MNNEETTIPKPKLQIYWQGLHVPFIAPWSNERVLPGTIVRRTGVGGTGIGYADELSHADRRRGVLWVRQSIAQGSGTPALGEIHPLRQRQAMHHMLCQVCGETTYNADFARWGERHLFLARAPRGRPFSEGEQTSAPPVCLPCAHESINTCPHLRKGYTAALVKYAQPWGVAGVDFDEATLRMMPMPPKQHLKVQIDHPRERWTLAMREIQTLHGVTPVDLVDLGSTLSQSSRTELP